jgi:6-phosphogluconolactonase
MSVVRCRDPRDLAEQGARHIASQAQAAVAARGRFLMVLTGGSTPEKTYEQLAASPIADKFPWDKTFFFEGDERVVPHDDPRSNFGMARRAMLSRVSIPADHLVPIQTDLPSAAACADDYQQRLLNFFGLKNLTTPPRFDLILFGLGDDGHVASLFPGYPTLEVRDRWVVSSPPGTLPPPVDRVTMTYPLLNAGRAAVFLVTGKNKAPAVRDVVEKKSPKEQRPAVGIGGGIGPAMPVTWFLDEEAASQLKPA